VNRQTVTVLVVDDHPLYREGVVAALERADSGIQVVGEAGDAESALTLARRLRPDVLLTDLRLPGHDGIWLAGSVQDAKLDIRVLVVTGIDDAMSVRAALDRGASGVVSKDSSAAQLSAAVLSVAAGGDFVSAQIARMLAASRDSADSDFDVRRELSSREREVLARLAAGESNRRIAEDLVLSVRTVDNHVRNLYAKLGVHDRAQAALSAARLGLVAMNGPVAASEPRS
jgi:DNA-binding NarL/FixJ family response regulator